MQVCLCFSVVAAVLRRAAFCGKSGNLYKSGNSKVVREKAESRKTWHFSCRGEIVMSFLPAV